MSGGCFGLVGDYGSSDSEEEEKTDVDTAAVTATSSNNDTEVVDPASEGNRQQFLNHFLSFFNSKM